MQRIPEVVFQVHKVNKVRLGHKDLSAKPDRRVHKVNKVFKVKLD
jgi:hypothetical protein